MAQRIISLLLILCCSLLLICCSDDDKVSAPDTGEFIYGLIGHDIYDGGPDLSEYWVYSRIYNHDDYRSITGIVETDQGNVGLVNGFDSRGYTYLHEGGNTLSFSENEEYMLSISDNEQTYSSNIKILPRLSLLDYTIADSQIVLEWTDVGADFYNVEIFPLDEYQKSFITSANQINIDISDWEPLDDVFIAVDGFKGFHPEADPEGNIDNGNGYFFGYTTDVIMYYGADKTFSRPESFDQKSNIERAIQSIQSGCYEKILSSVKLDYIFTYAYVSNEIPSTHYTSYLNAAVLTEPANAVKFISGTINNKELTHSSWSKFLNSLGTIEDVFETWNANDKIKFTINVNDLYSEAELAVPDTFSFIDFPSESGIPENSFDISWRRPVNTEFFIIELIWNNGYSLTCNEMFITEDTTYTIPGFPDDINWGRVNVLAVNGNNPLITRERNLEEVNGFYYTVSEVQQYLTFQELAASDIGKNVELDSEQDRRVQEYLINCLAENDPELRRYKNRIFSNLNNK